jgi:hypothetical protein
MPVFIFGAVALLFVVDVFPYLWFNVAFNFSAACVDVSDFVVVPAFSWSESLESELLLLLELLLLDDFAFVGRRALTAAVFVIGGVFFLIGASESESVVSSDDDDDDDDDGGLGAVADFCVTNIASFLEISCGFPIDSFLSDEHVESGGDGTVAVFGERLGSEIESTLFRSTPPIFLNELFKSLSVSLSNLRASFTSLLVPKLLWMPRDKFALE